MPESLKLRTAIGTYGHTASLKDGLQPNGIDLDHVQVEPIIAAYRRMVRGLEFDVCELAPTTYLMAREAGVPMTALPIFLMRKFHHADVVCRTDAGIERPADLAGHRVGVRAYSVTTGVWVRGILQHDHGVHLNEVTWVVDDEDHVLSYRPPENVVRLPSGESIAGEFATGKIAAALSGPAGVGRSGPPSGDWHGSDTPPAADHRPLFLDAAERAADWHRRTGIYPIHGVVVVRNDVLAERPWVAQSLFEAFTRARDDYVARLNDPDLDSNDDQRYRAVREVVGRQPLPFGIEDNRTSLQALIDIAYEQQLLSRQLTVEEIFTPLGA